jgi:triphosphoribosyl-dephospho-CoA synthase
MTAAQAWRPHSSPGDEPSFAAWDESLKAQGINPGTSADLTVATLMIAGLLGPQWHGT